MRHCHVSQTKEGSILWCCPKIDFVIKWNCSLCHPNWNWKRCDARDFNAFFSAFFLSISHKTFRVHLLHHQQQKTFFSTDFSQDFLASNNFCPKSSQELGALEFENQSHFWYNNLIQLFQGKYPSCSAWSRHEKSVKNRASQHQRLFSAFFTFDFLGQKQFSQSYFTFNEVDHNHAFCRHTDDLLP